MRPEAEYRRALELIRVGVNDCEIGRRRDPRGTIKTWRVGLRSASGGRTESRAAGRRQAVTCFRGNDEWVDEEAYAYLLGAYLGDGYITLMPRGSTPSESPAICAIPT